jgi:hypothetical protein
MIWETQPRNQSSGSFNGRALTELEKRFAAPGRPGHAGSAAGDDNGQCPHSALGYVHPMT